MTDTITDTALADLPGTDLTPILSRVLPELAEPRLTFNSSI